ncbi:MAG: hypothetical protein IJA58_05610 [Lachnospiraceae bacterium]|nr:hypothetical protein [Lachnospiraceae bacterium]
MKKFNKNIIVFVLVFLFIGFGFSPTLYSALRYCVIDLLVNNLPAQGTDAFHQFTSDVDNQSKKLLYSDVLLDLDSLKQRYLNTKLVQKGVETVVKTTDNALIVPYSHYPQDDLEAEASIIQSLQHAAEENGADFLYIAAPEKNMAYDVPANIENHSIDNFHRYMEALKQRDVPVLDLYNTLQQENMINIDTFFKTDHHWKPETAFWATGEICQALSDQYGFQYNKNYTNIENYNTQVYSDWFLGSYGKKVGLFFTSEGPDDITLITPKFETHLTEQLPLKEEERTGSFEQSVLHMDQIETKNYHGLSSYAAYGGGDFRLQIMKNNLNPEGKKILLIRDSFAGTVAPFLALNAGELHIIDVRTFIPDEAINVYEYLQQINPDYVLVLYSGTGNPENNFDRYNFGNP